MDPINLNLEVSELVETKIRFIERPSLAVLGQMLTKRFRKGVSVKAVEGGLEFTFLEDSNPGDINRLETMMERLGYIMEEVV